MGPILGAFLGTFLEACLNLYVKRDMHEHISIYYGLAMLEPLETDFLEHFGGDCEMLFRIPVLGGLQDHILMILNLFWGPFWRPFWALLWCRFCINFRRVSRTLQKSKPPESGRSFGRYLGSRNRSTSTR